MDWLSRAEQLETRWTSKDGSRWRIVFDVVELDGRPEPVGLGIRSWPRDRHETPRRLLSDHLREVNMASAFWAACREHAKQLRGEAELMADTDVWIDSPPLTADGEVADGEVRCYAGEELAQAAAAKARAASAAEARGRAVGRTPRFTTEDVERAAAVYLDAWREHRPPQKAVHEALDISRAQAGDLVRRARKKGLLPPTERRKAKGW